MSGTRLRIAANALLLWLIAQIVLATWTLADAAIAGVIAVGLTLMLPQSTKINGRGIALSAPGLLGGVRFGLWVLARSATGFVSVLAVVVGIRRVSSSLVTVSCSPWTATEVALATWAITLTPGSFLVRVEHHPKRLLIHVLDGSQAEALVSSIEALHQRALGPLFPRAAPHSTKPGTGADDG